MVVLTHADAADAEANIDRFANRLRAATGTGSIEEWSDAFILEESWVEGSAAVFVLRSRLADDNPFGTLHLALAESDTLFWAEAS